MEAENIYIKNNQKLHVAIISGKRSKNKKKTNNIFVFMLLPVPFANFSITAFLKNWYERLLFFLKKKKKLK